MAARGIKIGTLSKHALTMFALGGYRVLYEYATQIKPGTYSCPDDRFLVHIRNGGDGRMHTAMCCCGGTGLLHFRTELLCG